MKFKIIISIFIIGITGFIFFSHANNTKSNIAVTEISISKWKAKAPELFNYISKQSTINSKLIPESLLNMSGTITNPFGIWDENLEVIINEIPANNQLARKVAIQYAKNEQDIYFTNISKEEALKLDTKNSLLSWCLLQYLGKEKYISTIRKIDKFHIKTKDREERIWLVAKEIFAWKVLGTGLTKEEEEQLCDKGEF